MPRVRPPILVEMGHKLDVLRRELCKDDPIYWSLPALYLRGGPKSYPNLVIGDRKFGDGIVTKLRKGFHADIMAYLEGKETLEETAERCRQARPS